MVSLLLPTVIYEVYRTVGTTEKYIGGYVVPRGEIVV